MASRSAQTAICILRMEVQSWGPVITMTVCRDLSDPDAKRVTRFTDIREAATAATAFLESFKRESRP